MPRRTSRLVLILASVFIASIGLIQANVLAPPPDFKVFARNTDLIVVGTYTGATERVWTKETRYKKVLTDMHFKIAEVLKADGAHFKGIDSVDATTDGTADNEITKALTPGQQYVVFLKWVEPFQTYSLNYGLAGGYKIIGGEAVSMRPETHLVQRHGKLSPAQLVEMIKKSAN